MEAVTYDIAKLLDGDNALSEKQLCELVQTVRSTAGGRENSDAELRDAARKRASAWSRNAAMALKVGQGFYALNDYAEAVKWLDWAGPGKGVCFLKGVCLRELGDYDDAIESFEQAEQKGHDSFATAMAIVDCLRRKGSLQEAAAKLKRASRVGDIRAEYHFQLGRLHDTNGLYNDAMNEYEQAITLDANHVEALFYLAYACDLYKDEQEATIYYRRCIENHPIHVSALLNLAVIEEEMGKYDAAWCHVQQVLESHPNHARARLFLKDIESSVTMYYDEEQERRIDSRNKVLEIPISDFELSVRSRNCLRKMNIRMLGDLLKVTEGELLAYKNFGETSLQEIKLILASKGLRLGQMLEDRTEGAAGTETTDETEDNESEVAMAVSVGELTLSVRARKCLQRLNLNTVGELVKCTEAELLGCKNFGMTSLQEIQQALNERNLTLRTLEE